MKKKRLSKKDEILILEVALRLATGFITIEKPCHECPAKNFCDERIANSNKAGCHHDLADYYKEHAIININKTRR